MLTTTDRNRPWSESLPSSELTSRFTLDCALHDPYRISPDSKFLERKTATLS